MRRREKKNPLDATRERYLVFSLPLLAPRFLPLCRRISSFPYRHVQGRDASFVQPGEWIGMRKGLRERKREKRG